MAFNEPKYVSGICPMKDCDRKNCSECFKYHGKWTEYKSDKIRIAIKVKEEITNNWIHGKGE